VNFQAGTVFRSSDFGEPRWRLSPGAGLALWVVEDEYTNMDPEGASHYVARRLRDNGDYDPEGETVRFTGYSGSTNRPKDCVVVGKMTRLFVWDAAIR
jgi:hypothetical protein